MRAKHEDELRVAREDSAGGAAALAQFESALQNASSKCAAEQNELLQSFRAINDELHRAQERLAEAEPPAQDVLQEVESLKNQLEVAQNRVKELEIRAARIEARYKELDLASRPMIRT